MIRCPGWGNYPQGEQLPGRAAPSTRPEGTAERAPDLCTSKPMPISVQDFGAALSNCNVGRDDLRWAWMAAFRPNAPLVRRHGMATLGSTRGHFGHQCRANSKGSEVDRAPDSTTNNTRRQPPIGQFECRVRPQIIQVIAIRIPAGDREYARTQNVAQRVGDLVRITVVGNDRRKCIDQAGLFVGTGQQKHAAVGTDPASVESRRNLPLADTWQREWQECIVVVGGHGRFCPGIENGLSTQPQRDSRGLYLARQRIPAMQ
jgi:hypothetical protein